MTKRKTKMIKNQKTTKKMVRKENQAQPESKSNLLANVGSTLGGAAFGPVGSIIGKGAGSLISHIFGMGDYSVDSNAILEGAPPSFTKEGDGVCVTHREFISDVSGSVAFTLNSYSINPGLDSAFPWLSQLAANFEEYTMEGLVFEYRPTSGTAISTSSAALGTVVMATNYDVADSNFVNKQQMESYEFSSSCVPFNKMIHPVECKPGKNVLTNLYIRTGAVGTEDLRFYDLGNFQIATVGQQSAYVIGELWISYKVRFSKPRLQLPGDVSESYAHIREGASGSASLAHPLGTTGGIVSTPSTMIGTSPTTTTFLLPSFGTYGVFLSCTAGSGISGSPSLGLGANIQALSDFQFNAATSVSTFAGAAAFVSSTLYVSANGTSTGNTVTITGPAGYASGHTDLFIVQLPNSTTTT